MALNKKHYSLITIITVIVLVLTLPTSIYNNFQLFTGGNNTRLVSSLSFLPYNSQLYINDAYPFNLPLASVASTPAPAISCSLTNDYHMIGTDGSDFSNYNSGPTFTPLASLIVPQTGKTLDHVRVDVFLYCSPVSSYYSSIGYHAYLTSGSLSMQMKVNGNSGYVPVGSSQSAQVSYPSAIDLAPSGSVKIASFTFSASQIQSALGNPATNSLTLLQVVTTGNLNMQNKLSSSFLTYSYTVPPLYSFMSLQINGASTQTSSTSTSSTCPTGLYPYGNTCTSLIESLVLTNPTSSSSFKIDKSKSDSVQYQIQVTGFQPSLEQYPRVDIYKVVSGTQQLIKTAVFGSPTGTSGLISLWSGTLSIKNDLGGNTGDYILTLESSPILNGPTRQYSSVGFSVIDSSTTTQPTSQTTNITPTSTNSYYLWQIYYNDGSSDSGNLGSVPTFPVSFKSLDLLSSSGNGKQMTFMNVMPTIDMSKIGLNLAFNNVNIRGTMTVTASGNNLPQSVQNLKGVLISTPIVVNSLSNVGGGQVVITKIQFYPSQIDSVLNNLNQLASQTTTGFTTPGQISPYALPSGTNIKVAIVLNGTFNVVTNPTAGTTYQGIISPMTFNANFIYNPTQIALSQCVNINPSNPPPGCTNTNNSNLPSNSTAGDCQNLTANQCLAVNQALNNPTLNNSGCNSSTTGIPCYINVSNTTSVTTTTPSCTGLFGINTCQTPSTAPTDPSGTIPSVTPSSTPSGSTSPTTLCTDATTCQNLANSILPYLNIPVLNQNIYILIIGAVIVGIVIIIIAKARRK